MPYLVTDKRTNVKKLFSNFKYMSDCIKEVRTGKDMYLNISFHHLFYMKKYRRGESLNLLIERLDMIYRKTAKVAMKFDDSELEVD